MLNRWQSTIVDAQGNIQPFAILTILNEETQAPAQIYASESESQPLPAGTVVADESGYAYFYARGGRYRIQAADLSIDWRHVPLGNLAAMDSDQIVGGLGLGTAATMDAVSSDTDTSGGNKLVTQDWVDMNSSQGSSQGLGEGQTWQDMTANRSLGTTYTNTTGRTIVVSITSYLYEEESELDLYVDDVLVGAYFSGETRSVGSQLSAVVPSGSSYYAESYPEGSIEVIDWVELR